MADSSHSSTDMAGVAFDHLGLPAPVLEALVALGYESASPIQAATIPPLLAGRDVLGQAQTGTGKTAAFALPVVSSIDLSQSATQALVLAPTRELAIQVAEAFQRYAARLPDFHVLPIYGGQSYDPQLRGLRRGAHVVVGTPGRVLDHLQRGSLKLDALRWLVLDEADEMLRMGFVDDVETILKQAPDERQIALFSATMPPQIRRIAQTYLREPEEITIKARTTTATNIRQRYWWVSGTHKLDALTRILEAETFDGMIIFARTKLATDDLATRLQVRGFAAAALNGDVQQAQRERLVTKLKNGELDILVATDVAARGLDVERISHVINYDVPIDTESYVHRIGRTGRAGRSGDAILFIAPRERHLLRAIERATRQPIEPMPLPSADAVNEQRVQRFKQRIGEVFDDPSARAPLMQFQGVLGQFAEESGLPMIDIAAALARLLQGEASFLLDNDPAPTSRPPREREPRSERFERPERGGERPARPERKERSDRPERPERTERGERAERAGSAEPRPRRERPQRDEDSETYRVEVGSQHGVKASNLVGAIANEAGLESEYIGRIEIFDDYSLVQLPEGMPKAVYRDLRKTWVCGRKLEISKVEVGSMPAPVRKPVRAKTGGKPAADRGPRGKSFAKGPGKANPGKRPRRTD